MDVGCARHVLECGGSGSSTTRDSLEEGLNLQGLVVKHVLSVAALHFVKHSSCLESRPSTNRSRRGLHEIFMLRRASGSEDGLWPGKASHTRSMGSVERQCHHLVPKLGS